MDNDSLSFAGATPDYFDRGLGPTLFADFAAGMAQRVKALAPKLVVETAAGTGILTRALRDALPGRTKIIATDLSAPMIELARRKFARGEPVNLQTADAVSLPFDDECCDLLVCQFGMMFFADKEQSHRTAYRVLEDGGHYLVSVWDSHAFNSFAAVCHRVVGDLFPDDPPQFFATQGSCSAIDPIKSGLLEAGFSSVEISVNRIEKVVPDLDLFVRGLVLGTPLADQVGARGGDTEAVIAAILAALPEHLGTEPMVLSLQEIAFIARKGAVPRL